MKKEKIDKRYRIEVDYSSNHIYGEKHVTEQHFTGYCDFLESVSAFNRLKKEENSIIKDVHYFIYDVEKF